ncbi:MAG: alpha-E domain-containing protein [Sulfuricurvum sp.]|uniref:alpha-E domain-containing protein n=1 Tax=Sulfuricurvum sp. TaxID=2025608 RepID=UPI0025E421DC|nr:alpha-E domain-containing protein [Sulfuricurvum sp.]MCK9373683.1 alpha-E domain-containing protein [Sulfuricurvum sp.]
MTNGVAISVNTAQQLYWFGRYVQRAETILRELVKSYDYVIDRDVDDGRKLYAKLGVEIDYRSACDFLKQGVYGKQGGSIESIITWARENAIETRHLLDERGFAALNKIYNHISAGRERAVSPTYLEEAIDNFALILGIFSSELGRPKAYNFIRLGQQVERFDLILRLYDGIDLVNAELESMNAIGRRLNRNYQPLKITSSSIPKALSAVNGVIDRVIVKSEVASESSQRQGQ